MLASGGRRGDLLQGEADEGGDLFVEVGDEVALAGEDAPDRGGDVPVTFFELGEDFFDLGAGHRAIGSIKLQALSISSLRAKSEASFFKASNKSRS